jgi:nucleotide-binding universal stress UspA family protein
MSPTNALFVLVVVWALIGAVAGFVMARRGHARYPWTMLGVLLGPLVIPLAISATRREPVAPTTRLTRREPRSRELAVLVGVDGSEDAKGALVNAIALFDTRIGRLTIATVLDYDLERTAGGRDEQDRALEMLSTHAMLAAALLEREVETTMLSGRPADALVEYARDGNYDLIVVSPRGKGASRVLFGSVASQLARGVGVPVVILPPATRR